MRFCLLIVLCSFRMADAASTEVDLEKILEVAEKSDVAIERIIHQKKQAGFLKELSLPNSQILFELRNEYGIVVQGTGNTSVLSAGASKEFTNTGTTVSLNYTDNSQVGRQERTVGLRLEQSLFKNIFGGNTRRLDRALDLEKTVLLLEVAEAYEDYLAELIGQYLDWQLAYLNLEAAQSLLVEAEKIQKNLSRRQRKSVASGLDVDKAKIQTLSRKEAVLRNRAQYEALSGMMAGVLGEKKDWVPNARAPFIDQPVAFDADLRYLLEEGRSLKVARLKTEALTERVDYFKGQNTLDLKLVAGYNLDNSTRFNVNVDRGEALVGFNLEFPLGDSVAQAKTQQAVYEGQQAQLSRKETERDVKVLAESIRRQIEEKRTEVGVGAEKFELSKSVSRRERTRYTQGRIDFETLLTAENTLASNQFSHLTQKVQLAKLVVSWRKLTDRLLTPQKTTP